jgi:hypothetical protein
MGEQLVDKSGVTRVLVGAGTARRALKASAAALFAAAAVAVTPDVAEAQTFDPTIVDTDGNVPVYEVCIPEDPFLGDIGGGYVPTYDGLGNVFGYIEVNVCALERAGAGPNDLAYVIEHEMGHARGLLHTNDPRDLMYPAYRITGT